MGEVTLNHYEVGAVDRQGPAVSDCVSEKFRLDGGRTNETPCCPECTRMKEMLAWCRNELYKWVDFCADYNVNPFGEYKDYSDEVSEYFDTVYQNSGDAERLSDNGDEGP